MSAVPRSPQPAPAVVLAVVFTEGRPSSARLAVFFAFFLSKKKEDRLVASGKIASDVKFMLIRAYE
jgi:hypothetical protein